jgi:oligopeptide transport system substrate-binding protein
MHSLNSQQQPRPTLLRRLTRALSVKKIGNTCGLLIAMLVCLSSCSPQQSADVKTLRIPMRSDGPSGIDPVRSSSQYDNIAVSQIYECLLQYKYLKRPLELEPLLLAEMPTIAEDGVTWQFKLKKGVIFHDDPAFPNCKGRELVSADVFYSWKRMADEDNTPKGWWLYRESIVGFDKYYEEQNAAETFDYDAPVEGFKIINDHEFHVVLTKPVNRFSWILAMPFSSIVAREVVEKYGTTFPHHPVGTGPFRLEDGGWDPGRRLVLERNPNYHECFYPDEANEEDVKRGLTKDAGKRLPIVDRVEYQMIVQDQPMWLNFLAKRVDYAECPAEFFDDAYIKRTQKIRSSFRENGITSQPIILLDFIFLAFNMEDELVGGYTPEKKALRQAISLAIDLDERNRIFYNGINVVYDGMIPPTLAGAPQEERGPVSYRGPNLQRARQLLAKAGYPNGEGLPEIDYYTSRGRNNQEQTELLVRQLSKINVKLKPKLVDFSQLMEIADNKKAAMFAFAWGSDYPDGENNLALFYGPNESPGSNHFNYKNKEYDRLYEQAIVMAPSEERTKLYEKMRDMVLEDCAFVGSMARTRFYLVHEQMKNFKATEDFYNWPKYIDLER